MAEYKYLDEEGLTYYHSQVKSLIDGKQDALADGQTVPVGGSTGQVLTKTSDTDYDTEWADAGGESITLYTRLGNNTDGAMTQSAITSALFNTVSASSYSNVKIGRGATSIGGNTVNIGDGNYCASYSTVLGSGAQAYGSSSIAIGQGTLGRGTYSVAIGPNITISTQYSGTIALGAFSGTLLAAVGQVDFSSSSASYGYNSTTYRQIKGIYAGEDDNDAVNVAQMNEAITNATADLTTSVNTLTTNVETLSSSVDTINTDLDALQTTVSGKQDTLTASGANGINLNLPAATSSTRMFTYGKLCIISFDFYSYTSTTVTVIIPQGRGLPLPVQSDCFCGSLFCTSDTSVAPIPMYIESGTSSGYINLDSTLDTVGAYHGLAIYTTQ